MSDLRAETRQGFNCRLLWLVTMILGAVGAELALIGYVS